MSKFYSLKTASVNRETADSVSIELEIPNDLQKEFHYKQGQYLTFRLKINGNEIRRSYSLCSAPSVDSKLKVAVKEVANGQASQFLNKNLKSGDILECMPPMGNFYTSLDDSQKLTYAGIVAGSGITPVISLIKETLFVEKESRFILIYANKNKDSVIFKNELDELVNQHGGRLEIHYLYSRENTGEPLLFGRPDKQKLEQILTAKGVLKANHYFICGPEEMIMNANEILQANKIDKSSIHFELFTTPVKMGQELKVETSDFTGTAKVKVTIDGIVTNFNLSTNGSSILDAAMDAGADAPYSCKGAVCCTCKAKVIKGKAIMDMNYALTDKEVEQGYILSCQAHPQTAELEVDFDVS